LLILQVIYKHIKKKGGEKMKKYTLLTISAGAAVLLLSGYFLMSQPQDANKPDAGQKTNIVTENKTMNTKNLVETASEAGNFKTLLTAAQEAGIAQTLASEGPFTVFAPTDEAFAKLPEGTVENLLKDKEALTKILTYHVLPGKVMSKDVLGVTSAKTLQGQEVSFSTTGNGVMINEANIIQTDIEASNGVIHIIDSVILPE
jgi:uncharacterized surface protein with fasciclin (FAS1) repeats